ncbi:hypothetical protein STEG23_031458 [Scotinomys teguina]
MAELEKRSSQGLLEPRRSWTDAQLRPADKDQYKCVPKSRTSLPSLWKPTNQRPTMISPSEKESGQQRKTNAELLLTVCEIKVVTGTDAKVLLGIDTKVVMCIDTKVLLLINAKVVMGTATMEVTGTDAKVVMGIDTKVVMDTDTKVVMGTDAV